LVVPNGLSDQEEKNIGLLGYWYKLKLLEYPLVQGYLVPHSRVRARDPRSSDRGRVHRNMGRAAVSIRQE